MLKVFLFQDFVLGWGEEMLDSFRVCSSVSSLQMSCHLLGNYLSLILLHIHSSLIYVNLIKSENYINYWMLQSKTWDFKGDGWEEALSVRRKLQDT